MDALDERFHDAIAHVLCDSKRHAEAEERVTAAKTELSEAEASLRFWSDALTRRRRVLIALAEGNDEAEAFLGTSAS